MTDPDSKTSETSTEEAEPVESPAAGETAAHPPRGEETGAETVSGTKTEAVTPPLTEAEAESGTESVTETESGDETESVTESETVSVTEAETAAESGTETVSVTETESGTGSETEAVSETAPLTEAEAESGTATVVGEADTVAGDVAAAEAQADTVAGDAAPDAGAESSAGDVKAEGAGKKKRRRRRKKKGAQAGPSDAPPDAKSAHHHAPFLHLFSGGGTRKHAFSAGEEIAGRVERVEHGTIIVDVFGKATAIVDVDEPREIPIIIHEAQELKVEAEATTEEATASPAPADVPAVEAAAVPTPVIQAPTPEMAKLIEDDASAWEFSTTDVTDLSDDDLGEADTVVSAQAYDPTIATEAQLAATEPPVEEVGAAAETSAETAGETAAGAAAETAAETAAGAETASKTASETETETESETVAETETGTETGTDTVSEAVTGTETGTETVSETVSETETVSEIEPAEDPADADLTLLDPLPELEVPQVGAIFRGRIGSISESGHIAIVNRVIDKAAVRKALRAARELHHRVQGVVYGYNRGGFDVLVGGVRAFCPASAMSLSPIEDPNAFVGQRCEFSLPQDKGGKKSIIVSRRNILEKEARKKARERMAELEVGTKLPGKVLEVRDYVRPHDVAKVGDEVDVEILKIQQASRKDRYGRVSLSMRACQPDPYDTAKDILRPGTPIKGKVVRTTDFGAFVELQENIEGLLHISELGGSKELTHAKQAVSEGDEIHVVVERVDRGQRRISLSKLSDADAKAIEAGEIEIGKAPRSLKPGSHVAVIVKRVEHAGAQVQVDGMLGKRGRGFIPNRELQDLPGEKRKGVSQGDVMEVKIIGTDRDGSLRCSIRARLLDDERKAVREYRKESAKQGLGTFGDLLKAKLGEGSD
jgi:small subunit ribosomal protein S1